VILRRVIGTVSGAVVFSMSDGGCGPSAVLFQHFRSGPAFDQLILNRLRALLVADLGWLARIASCDRALAGPREIDPRSGQCPAWRRMSFRGQRGSWHCRRSGPQASVLPSASKPAIPSCRVASQRRWAGNFTSAGDIAHGRLRRGGSIAGAFRGAAGGPFYAFEL